MRDILADFGMQKKEGNGRCAVSTELRKDLLGLSDRRDCVVTDLDKPCAFKRDRQRGTLAAGVLGAIPPRMRRPSVWARHRPAVR